MGQSLCINYVHFVWSTKDRAPFLQPQVRPRVHAFLGGIARELASPAIEVGGVEDHVHLLVNLAKSCTVSEFVERAKSSSSAWIRRELDIPGDFRWQSGYGAFSISAGHVNAVTRYIQGREEHHRKVTFADELRRILTLYRAEYDERYLWD
ncbi:IS200/IS605 family transposase [bacterium]|nr:IS200/IS605 family transposase [bacterium]